jgi:hypothetical protein
VDYHFNGQMPPRNLFYATSDSKALLVTAVSHFLRSHGEAFQTMTVIDPARVTPKQIERIQFASDELKYGVDGNESDIVRFALGAELT